MSENKINTIILKVEKYYGCTSSCASLVLVNCLIFSGMSKLRKTEERKRKEEQKKTSSGRFDVHSIMNRAFEMRRKAMEASDSEGGEEDSDENEDEWEED